VVERKKGSPCDPWHAMTDAIARNNASDAAGRWLLPIISPQEVRKAER
jgi:hypothetical protein